MKGKKIIIVGASSGIGRAFAELCLQEGAVVGVVARREAELLEIKKLKPEAVHVKRINICSNDSLELLDELVQAMGGMDHYFHSSGMGYQLLNLDEEKDLATVELNTYAFTRCTSWAFNYFERQGYGHLTAISSIAGTKGIGSAATYSASKAYQATFLQALRQLKRMKGLDKVHITDIRPGFVATDLLKDDKYMMLMKAEDVAQSIFKAISKKKSVCTIDWRYRILVVLWRMLPRFLWERLTVKS